MLTVGGMTGPKSPPPHRLREAVANLFGDVTVAASLAERAELLERLAGDERAWERLWHGYRALRATPLDAWPDLVRALGELERRALVLAVLDPEFLPNLGRAIVAAVRRRRK